MLNSQQKDILHLLLDKYEKRKDYGKEDKNRRRTILHVDRRSFPDYYHISDSRFRTEFNMDAVELQEKGYLIIDWKKFKENDEIERIILIEDHVAEIYEQLQRVSKQEKYRLAKNILLRWKGKAPDCLTSFYTDMNSRMESFETLPSIFNIDSRVETEEALYGLHELLKNKEEFPRRKWSIRLYNDSKKWEKIEGKILNIVRKYVWNEENELLDDDQLLEHYGIIKNPHHIHLSGKLIIKKDGTPIDLSIFNPDIGLEPRFFNACTIEKVKADAVITIENLTSYYDYLFFKERNNRNEIVLYLGGYHNEGRRLIINKLKQFIDERQLMVPFYHWGDIDMHGLYIWNHLRTKTEMEFKPLYMDRKTYLKYVNKGKPMRVSDKKQLKKLLGWDEYKIFHPLIMEMLKYGKVIEQEAVVL